MNSYSRNITAQICFTCVSKLFLFVLLLLLSMGLNSSAHATDYALEFDGSNDYVNAGSGIGGGSNGETVLRIGDLMTMQIWFKLDNTRFEHNSTEAGIKSSVGSVGDSYDNALAETINGLYKTELIRKQGPWKGVDDVEYAILEWVDWFNNRRLLEPIGDIPPAELEEGYYQQLEESAMVA